jgi:hypothetical protein
MALEKVEGSLEKVAMGNHEKEKERISKVFSWLARFLKSKLLCSLERNVRLFGLNGKHSADCLLFSL